MRVYHKILLSLFIILPAVCYAAGTQEIVIPGNIRAIGGIKPEIILSKANGREALSRVLSYVLPVLEKKQPSEITNNVNLYVLDYILKRELDIQTSDIQTADLFFFPVEQEGILPALGVLIQIKNYDAAKMMKKILMRHTVKKVKYNKKEYLSSDYDSHPLYILSSTKLLCITNSRAGMESVIDSMTGKKENQENKILFNYYKAFNQDDIFFAMEYPGKLIGALIPGGSGISSAGFGILIKDTMDISLQMEMETPEIASSFAGLVLLSKAMASRFIITKNAKLKEMIIGLLNPIEAQAKGSSLFLNMSYTPETFESLLSFLFSVYISEIINQE